MKLMSSAFTEGGAIPDKYSCKGENVSPPFTIEGVPEKAQTLALIMDDPDAPVGTFDHWLVWNVPAATTEWPEHSLPVGVVQGNNGRGEASYTGPCPPSGTHHYHFKLYALDAPLDLKAGAGKAELEQAMQGHTVDQTELIGTFAAK